MAFDELTQGNAHRLFDIAGFVHMAGDAEDFRAGVVRSADAGKPFRATAQYGRHNGNGLNIVDSGRTAINADVGREWRLQARLAFLALEALQQCRLFAANISAGAVMDVAVEIPAVNIVPADERRLIGFIDSRLKPLALADEFPTHLDVASMGVHREAGNQATFDEEMRIIPHDVAVLAGTWLRFVGVDDEIVRPVFHLLGHELPFEARGETRAASAAQSRALHYF